MGFDRRRRPRPPRGVTTVAALTAAVLAAVAAPGVAHAHEGHAPLPTKGAAVQGDRVLLSEKARGAMGLDTAKVTLGDLRRVVRAQARVELPWHQQAMITTLVPGRIGRVLVRPGDAVAAGQELAVVDSLELEAFQRELLQADAERHLARQVFDLRESLQRQKILGMAGVLEARRALEEQSARVVIAEQKLLALGLDREALRRLRATGQPLLSLPVVSPIRGVVTHADVRVGQQVEPTQHLYHVVDTAEVGIVGEVLESDAAAVSVGQRVRVRLAALPGRSVEAVIHHVHPEVNPRTHTQEAVAHVPNPDGALRPGLSGVMEVEVARAKDAIVCPTSALVDDPSGPFVLRARGQGTFERRRVRTGLREGDRAEVLDGLFPGDLVVTSGKNLLASLLAHAQGPAKPVFGPVRRVAGSADSPVPAPGRGASDAAVVAVATVEWPTDRKRFAGPRIEGRVARILVGPGQVVRAGQVLAEVDSLPLRNLQLDLLRARAVREWTQRTVERYRELRDLDIVAKKDLWKYEADLKVLDRTLGSLRTKLRSVGLPDDDLRRLEEADLAGELEGSVVAPTVPVRAPAAGRLAHFDAVPGQVVRPSDAPFHVFENSPIWVKGYVFERQSAAVHVGQSARVSFPALGDRVLSGTVVRTSPTLEDTERVLPVWVEVENPGGVLVEGMMARVTIAAAPQGRAETGRAVGDAPIVAANRGQPP
jgi:membrane fusion protein, heavy metal efflux system